VYVRLSVHERISATARPNIINLLHYYLQSWLGHPLAVLRYHVLPVLWMTSHFPQRALRWHVVNDAENRIPANTAEVMNKTTFSKLSSISRRVRRGQQIDKHARVCLAGLHRRRMHNRSSIKTTRRRAMQPTLSVESTSAAGGERHDGWDTASQSLHSTLAVCCLRSKFSCSGSTRHGSALLRQSNVRHAACQLAIRVVFAAVHAPQTGHRATDSTAARPRRNYYPVNYRSRNACCTLAQPVHGNRADKTAHRYYS